MNNLQIIEINNYKKTCKNLKTNWVELPGTDSIAFGEFSYGIADHNLPPPS